MESSLQLQRSGLISLDFFENVDNSYGVEEDSLVLGDNEGVETPEIEFQLMDDHREELKSAINPDASSDCYGIDLYEASLTFIYNKVRSCPNIYGELS